jgi:hypothetical protein
MSEDVKQSEDVRLGRLLRAARPTVDLPAGFQNLVWQRIEKGEEPAVGTLERLAAWFLTPRFVTAGLAALVILAAGAGAVHGMRMGERAARDRYVASVDPSYSHR